MELEKLSIDKAHELLCRKEISSEELTKAFLKRIEDIDENIKAYVTLNGEKALDESRQLDKDGDFSEYLTGIPAAIKDNICTKDLRTTCSSKMLENFVPPYDATVIAKLKDNKALILGKTNMDEFGMGSSTENSYFFTSRNPWNPEHVPGSSASAAAVAASEALFALDSDTGGAIRQSASYCGVVGLRPTYGRVSRFGLAASASSLDTIGPVTKTVKDCAIVLNAIAGLDSFDPTSSETGVPDFIKSLETKPEGIKIGIPKEFLGQEVCEDVKAAVLNAAKTFEDMGCVCEEVSLPHSEYSLWAYLITASAEASSELGIYDGIRFGYRAQNYADLKDLYKRSRGEAFGMEAKRRIILGTYLLDSKFYDKYYLKAQKLRTLIKEDFKAAFEKYDFLITPTTPTTAFKIGEKKGDLVSMYKNDICTSPVSLAGLPAISIPCGFAEDMPIGLQIIGKAFDEAGILQLAYAFEQNTDYHNKELVRKEA